VCVGSCFLVFSFLYYFIIISLFVLFAAEGDELYKAVYHKEHVYCKSTMAWSNHSYSQNELLLLFLTAVCKYACVVRTQEKWSTLNTNTNSTDSSICAVG
jgi:hypothetical protein